jgi:hypothetical protein
MPAAIAAASSSVATHRLEAFQPMSTQASDTVGAVADPTAGDYQQALSIFGDVVGRAKQGAKFGHEDMLRFREGMREHMARTDLPASVREALSSLEVAFQDSYRPDASDRFGSSNWADFLGKVGDLLGAAPGGAQIGQAFKEFSDKFRRADRGSDVFDGDDMARLQGRSPAKDREKAERGDRERSTGRPGDNRVDRQVRSSDDLISRASEKFEGRVFGAEDFSRFFKNLKFDFSSEAAPSPAFPPSPGLTPGGAVAGQTSPGPMGIAPVVATSPPVAASTSAVAATATGSGVAAGNGVNGNGNLAIGGDVILNAGVINVAFNFPQELPADLVLSEANRLG